MSVHSCPITIDRTLNGYLVRHGGGGSTPVEQTFVFQDLGSAYSSKSSLLGFLFIALSAMEKAEAEASGDPIP